MVCVHQARKFEKGRGRANAKLAGVLHMEIWPAIGMDIYALTTNDANVRRDLAINVFLSVLHPSKMNVI